MSSPVTARTSTEQALAAIDATLAADEVMCFCGCAHLVTAASPSMYFAAQECSELWHRFADKPDDEAKVLRHNARVLWEANNCRSWPGSLPHAGRIGDVDDTPVGYSGVTPWRDLTPAQRRLWVTMGNRLSRMPQVFPGEAATWRELRDGARAWWWERQDAVDRAMAATEWAVAAYRDPSHPEHGDVAAQPPTQAPPRFMRRVAQSLRRALGGQAFEDYQREQLRQHLRDTIGSGDARLWQALADDEAAQQRLREGQWSFEYLNHDPVQQVTWWRVWVGCASEDVVVRSGQSHQEIVRASVERIRARQNGRL